MANDSVIHESDLIQLDGTIDKLVEKLERVNSVLLELSSTLQNSASTMSQNISKLNVVTENGQNALSASAIAADRLEKAYRELEIASSATGQEIAQVKSQISAVNKESVANFKALQMLSGSYDELKANLTELQKEYKKLSEEERENENIGGVLLQRIQAYAQKVKELDSALKPHIEKIQQVAVAHDKLSVSHKSESKSLDELEKRMAKVNKLQAENAKTSNDLAISSKKLANGMYEVTVNGEKLNLTTEEYTKYLKYNVRANEAAIGSYKQISNQHSALNILWKASANEAGKAGAATVSLGKKLKDLRNQMQRMQESVGNYTLNVGNYRSAWDGLGMSVNQIVRELPSAAISLNTFFVAISNNIPILVDEINKLRRTNKILQAEGKKTISVGKGIIKAIFSWNTAIVLIVTTFSMFGKEIVSAISSMFNFQSAVMSAHKAIKNLNKEMESTNDSYGSHLVLYKRLQEEFKELTTDADKLRYIQTHQTYFDELGQSINTITEAETYLIENTESAVEALERRARAAAAFHLAEEEYTKAMVSQAKLENMEAPKESGFLNFFFNDLTDPRKQAAIYAFFKNAKDFETHSVRALQYLQLGKTTGVQLEEDDDKDGGGKGKSLIDLTERINSMRLAVEKKFQDSKIAITKEGYERDRAVMVIAAEKKKMELEAIRDKNLRWLAGSGTKYVALTAEQRRTINDANEKIEESILNNQKDLAEKLLKLDAKYSIKRLNQKAGDLNLQMEAQKEGSKKEIELRIELIKTQRDIEIAENKLKIEEEQQEEVKIREKYQREIAEEEAKIGLLEIEALETRYNDRLKIIKKGTEAELEMRIKLLELDKKRALAEDNLLSPDKQRGAEAIEMAYEKEKKIMIGNFDLERYKARQKNIMDEFNLERRSTYAINKLKLQQEKELIEKKLQLYEEGKLNLTPAEVTNLKIQRQRNANETRENKLDYSPTGILSKLGFDEEAIDGLDETVNYVIDKIKEIYKAEEELREKQVEAAKEKAEIAKSNLDAEIEARNKGYANNVETTKKELLLAKKDQKEKEKLLKEAQARSAKIDTLTQASSLITATAEIWKSLSGVPIVGPILAAAAVGSMWASFTVAKVKAKQVASQQYGKGGLEFMEGGSHASGNDINLGIKNKKGKQMRVEGGEAVAVINKASTRRYRSVLPDIVKSLNSGKFEERFMQKMPSIQPNIIMNQRNEVDLSKVEDGIEKIRRQNEMKSIVLADGSIVEISKNRIRTIRK